MFPYLQLGEECVETVDLLLFLDKGVVLSDSLQRQLLHQVNLVWVSQVLPLSNTVARAENFDFFKCTPP